MSLNKNAVLEPIFTQLLRTYTSDTHYIETLWQELSKKYSGQKRYYHNLSHLEAMFQQLTFSKAHIQEWDTILFSLFYHDVIYKPLRQDNEAQSAALAVKRLQVILPAELLSKCHDLILATKTHEWSSDADTNFFTDADLSVLGQDWNVYEMYFKNIRKEYAIYPDFIYNNGRKKVLEHFLNKERIFKTAPFFEAYVQQARKNITTELGQLAH